MSKFRYIENADCAREYVKRKVPEAKICQSDPCIAVLRDNRIIGAVVYSLVGKNNFELYTSGEHNRQITQDLLYKLIEYGYKDLNADCLFTVTKYNNDRAISLIKRTGAEYIHGRQIYNKEKMLSILNGRKRIVGN